MEQLKDQTSTHSNNIKHCKIMEIVELIDTLRVLNPTERKFIYCNSSRLL